MAANLTVLIERLRVYVVDKVGLVWDDDLLEESIRQALVDMQLVTARSLTISGLDGMTESTLDTGLETLLVRGAGAYAVEMRTIDRADAFELNQTGLEMGAWARQAKEVYWTDLERKRLQGFQNSSSAPYFPLPDPFLEVEE